MKRVVFHPHAVYKIQQRNLNPSIIIDAIMNPEKVLTGRFDRKIAHKISGRYRLKIVFEEYQDYFLVITAYPTRKERN